MRVVSILVWPFVQLWGLIRILAGPLVLIAGAYFLLPDAWFALVALVVGSYAVIVIGIWRAAVRGSKRAMARGAITVRKQRSGR